MMRPLLPRAPLRTSGAALAVLLVLGTCDLQAAPLDETDTIVAEEQGSADDEKKEAEDEKPKKSFWSRFKDPKDGRFDVAAGSKGASGFLPLLIPFNEPAIGVGVAGALAYFHPTRAPQSAEGIPNPPSTTFGGGGLSENGTWAGVVGHMGVWRKGRVRYRGLIGFTSAELEFYGIGSDPVRNDNPIPLTVKGAGIVQQAEFKLGQSRFFAGGRYAFSTTETTFGGNSGGQQEGTSENAGLTLFMTYDSRDTTFTPGRGTHVKVAFSYFAELFGGDFDYGRIDMFAHRYWPLFDDRLILGGRLEYQQAGDNSPFYALPWIRLRGIPAFRNLGNYAVTSEIEPRFKIDERWSLVAFGGVGRAARDLDRLDDAEHAYSFGTGFRYLLARKLGLAAGIDVARGPEETVVYLIFGSAWGI